MKPTEKEKKLGHPNQYSRDELLQKLRNIQGRKSFKKSNGLLYTPDELAGFLYKINFLTARKMVGEQIHRLYYEENQYIYNTFADFGYGFEVHPAYRWALQPSDNSSIYAQFEIEEDE